jgi:hypothetical protein
MQLLLSCLNFLRGQYLDAMVAWVAKPAVGRGGKPPKGGSAHKEAGSSGGGGGESGVLSLEEIATWNKVGSGWWGTRYAGASFHSPT